jgi:hypothetical protein
VTHSLQDYGEVGQNLKICDLWCTHEQSGSKRYGKLIEKLIDYHNIPQSGLFFHYYTVSRQVRGRKSDSKLLLLLLLLLLYKIFIDLDDQDMFYFTSVPLFVTSASKNKQTNKRSSLRRYV